MKEELGDKIEKVMKADFESLTKYMKEGLGDKVEKKATSKPMKEVLGDMGENILDSGRGENKEY
eukprot:4761549-Heterocapsa_arctica.AAC.1